VEGRVKGARSVHQRSAIGSRNKRSQIQSAGGFTDGSQGYRWPSYAHIWCVI